MKRLLFFSVVLAFCSCQFSAGVSTDLATGLTISNKGLSYSESILASGGKKMESNKLKLGSEFIVGATGCSGFTSKAGLVFPACSIVLRDEKGTTILNIADAFEALKDGRKPNESSELTATITTGSPMNVGMTYAYEVIFSDRMDTSKIITCKGTIVME